MREDLPSFICFGVASICFISGSAVVTGALLHSHPQREKLAVTLILSGYTRLDFSLPSRFGTGKAGTLQRLE
jgi:hypothetical protein